MACRIPKKVSKAASVLANPSSNQKQRSKAAKTLIIHKNNKH